MRPSSCLGPQLPGSAFSCRSRQMVARLRKKRLFCSTTTTKKKAIMQGEKKKNKKNPHSVFSPPPSSVAWMAGTAWLSRACPHGVGSLPAPSAWGAGGDGRAPKYCLRHPHMSLWQQRMTGAPSPGDAAAKSSRLSASVRAGCAGAVRKALGFPLYIAFPVDFASCRD